MRKLLVVILVAFSVSSILIACGTYSTPESKKAVAKQLDSPNSKQKQSNIVLSQDKEAERVIQMFYECLDKQKYSQATSFL